MKKLLLIVISIAALASLTGCTAFLIGAGAAGTVGLGLDAIRLERYVSEDRAWAAAIDTLNARGIQILSENQKKGTISAKIEDTDLSIQILGQKSKTTTIDVKARKKGLPNLELANKIIDDINTRLKTSKPR